MPSVERFKHIPNLLTTLRMALCLPLLLAKPLSPVFVTLYLFCGLSDVFDGHIARRLRVTSKRGAALDSVADAVFVFVILIKLIPVIALPPWLLIWITAITLIKLASLALGYYKYRALAFLHTYTNKATGVLLFCFPLCVNSPGMIIAAYLVCAVASLAALEELLINVASKNLVRDVRSILDHRQVKS